jgi:uncharacterized membrane protein
VAGADASRHIARGRSIASGVFTGIGIAGFVDETVFHQLLHWHHFWDGGSQSAGLVSDGFFHAGSWFSIVAGLFWFADLRRRAAWQPRAWAGGVLLGAGGFQLYDGLVQHKLLGLHQIRYHVTIWPYDLVWNTLAAIMMVLGAVFVLQSRRRAVLAAGVAADSAVGRGDGQDATHSASRSAR